MCYAESTVALSPGFTDARAIIMLQPFTLQTFLCVQSKVMQLDTCGGGGGGGGMIVCARGSMCACARLSIMVWS